MRRLFPWVLPDSPSLGWSGAWAALLPLLALLSSPTWTPLHGQAEVLDAFDLSGGPMSEARLSRDLQEISGLAVNHEGRLFAHNDERGVVYELEIPSGRILGAFSVGYPAIHGDFEGIAVHGSTFFLVTSTGEVVETEEGAPGSAMEYRIHRTGLGNQCEMEGLAYDGAAGTLLLPCKDPRARDLRGHIVVFSLEVGPMAVAPVPRIFLPLDELETVGLKASFSPSGIEVDPLTGHLILISARDQAILEFSSQGALLGGQRLKKKLHPQVEGIAFDLDAALILADEGGGSRGRLTRYPRLGQGSEGGRPR